MSSIKKVNCPRCNKEVYFLKKKYEGICSDCITAEEQDEMLLEQAKGMLRSCMEDGR
jgi:NMD protein affecting ribosome stability and mRNA decay